MKEAVESSLLAFAANSPEPPGYVNVEGSRKQFYLTRDAEVKRCLPLGARGTPEFERALAAFRNSPLTGCTTVLDLLRRKSGYQPATPNSGAMTMFVARLLQHPLFRPKPGSPMKFDCIVGSNLDCNSAAIVRKYRGTDAEASRRIDQQLQLLAGNAIRNPGHWQKSEMLLEHSLGAGDAITFYMGRSAAQSVYVMMPPANYMYQVQGEKGEMIWDFDTAAWPNHAEAVLQEHLKLVPDWIEENSH